MKKHTHGGRPQLLHDRTPMIVSFERDRLREFEQYCSENHISVSQGIRELLEEFLEKKEEGELPNPLGLPIVVNKLVTNTEKPLQTDLREWISKEKAIQLCKKIPRENLWQLKSAANNMRIGYRFRTEGVIEV